MCGSTPSSSGSCRCSTNARVVRGFELVIVDDGSTDSTAVMLDELSRADDRRSADAAHIPSALPCCCAAPRSRPLSQPPAGPFVRTLHVGIRVGDLDRSLAFY